MRSWLYSTNSTACQEQTLPGLTRIINKKSKKEQQRKNSFCHAPAKKKDDAEGVGDFRPISLINSVPKLITKVLSMRLTDKMGSIVSPAQSAFLKERCLQDNYLNVRNSVRSLHRRRKPALLIKLDIARAFDSVSWEFVLELPQQLGFGP